MEIVTRQEALRQGLKRYFTGKPCKHGHLSERNVSDSVCRTCRKEIDSRLKASDPKYFSKATKRYYLANKIEVLEKAKKVYHENPKMFNERSKQYRTENPEAYRNAHKKYRDANRGKRNADTSLYRANRLKATPSWADLQAIKAFYQNCPKGYHVDHVVPLRHPLVCGLHVLNNLQYLTAEDNFKKGNSFTVA